MNGEHVGDLRQADRLMRVIQSCEGPLDKFVYELKGETGKLAEATTNALARVELAEFNTKQAVAGIQADIDQIESDKAAIQELMQKARAELETAQEELNQLETGGAGN